MTLTYRHTRNACFVGYVTQAIVNNLSPLLFLTFQQEFSISLGQISLIITLNFAVQMLVDLLSAHFVDKIGYRTCIVAAHLVTVLGLAGLAGLPRIMAPYAGLLVATLLNAVGGGLLEVLVSPMIEALPSQHKEREMSLLHSFYCWGHMAVVLLSTGYFLLLGTKNWRFLPLFWALVPLLNGLVLMKAPLCTLQAEGRNLSIGKLVQMPLFWLLFLLMICSGASEQAVSQWSSAFAEKGLGVSKTMGDLLGPMLFAVSMASSRTLYGIKGHKLNLKTFMWISVGMCILAYGMIALIPNPVLALLGCGVAGFSVGIFWPGTFSTASASVRGRGTLLFALLALAGDLGCAGGPTLAGMAASAFGGNMRLGLGVAVIYPVLLGLGMLLHKTVNKEDE